MWPNCSCNLACDAIIVVCPLHPQLARILPLQTMGVVSGSGSICLDHHDDLIICKRDMTAQCPDVDFSRVEKPPTSCSPTLKFLEKRQKKLPGAQRGPHSKRNFSKHTLQDPQSKILVRNSGAGNGYTNFMGAWKNALFLQEKPMSIKFLVLGGGGSADFIFLCARIFEKFLGKKKNSLGSTRPTFQKKLFKTYPPKSPKCLSIFLKLLLYCLL